MSEDVEFDFILIFPEPFIFSTSSSNSIHSTLSGFKLHSSTPYVEKRKIENKRIDKLTLIFLVLYHEYRTKRKMKNEKKRIKSLLVRPSAIPVIKQKITSVFFNNFVVKKTSGKKKVTKKLGSLKVPIALCG
jgi:hypothetical protein